MRQRTDEIQCKHDRVVLLRQSLDTVVTSPKIPATSLKYRLDKWLWAARFYKTRSLASDEIARNRVSVNGLAAKASREVRLEDRIELRQGSITKIVIVKGLSEVRGSAPVALSLYSETPESIAQRKEAAEQRRFAGDPSSALAQGRPTKKDRRKLADWNRWSASSEP